MMMLAQKWQLDTSKPNTIRISGKFSNLESTSSSLEQETHHLSKPKNKLFPLSLLSGHRCIRFILLESFSDTMNNNNTANPLSEYGECDRGTNMILCQASPGNLLCIFPTFSSLLVEPSGIYCHHQNEAEV